MDTADGLPFFDLLRNRDHPLSAFCNVNTILLRKTSSRENIRPPGNPFLVSYYSVIKSLVIGIHHSPITIHHLPITNYPSPYSEEGKSKLLQVTKKIRTFILPVASQAYFHFATPHPKSPLLCSVLLWEKMLPRPAAWNNGCEDYPGHS